MNRNPEKPMKPPTTTTNQVLPFLPDLGKPVGLRALARFLNQSEIETVQSIIDSIILIYKVSYPEAISKLEELLDNNHPLYDILSKIENDANTQQQLKALAELKQKSIISILLAINNDDTTLYERTIDEGFDLLQKLFPRDNELAKDQAFEAEEGDSDLLDYDSDDDFGLSAVFSEHPEKNLSFQESSPSSTINTELNFFSPAAKAEKPTVLPTAASDPLPMQDPARQTPITNDPSFYQSTTATETKPQTIIPIPTGYQQAALPSQEQYETFILETLDPQALKELEILAHLLCKNLVTTYQEILEDKGDLLSIVNKNSLFTLSAYFSSEAYENYQTSQQTNETAQTVEPENFDTSLLEDLAFTPEAIKEFNTLSLLSEKPRWDIFNMFVRYDNDLYQLTLDYQKLLPVFWETLRSHYEAHDKAMKEEQLQTETTYNNEDMLDPDDIVNETEEPESSLSPGSAFFQPAPDNTSVVNNAISESMVNK